MVPSNNGTGMVDGSTRRSDAEWRNVIFAKVAPVERTGVEIQNTIASHYSETTRNLLKMDPTIKQIAVSRGVCHWGQQTSVAIHSIREGWVKFKYSRRTIVWDVIENMCNRNVVADVAIDRIIAECGGQDTPANYIIKRLREAKKSGDIQNLQLEPTHL